jgi:hypothetical protein
MLRLELRLAFDSLLVSTLLVLRRMLLSELAQIRNTEMSCSKTNAFDYR